jgi:hypothetical protein
MVEAVGEHGGGGERRGQRHDEQHGGDASRH